MDFSDFIIGIVVIFIAGAVLTFLWQLIRGKPIKKMQVNKDVEGLIRASKDEDFDVRMIAVGALVKIGELAVEPLTKALKDEDGNVREQAAWALRKIGK